MIQSRRNLLILVLFFVFVTLLFSGLLDSLKKSLIKVGQIDSKSGGECSHQADALVDMSVRLANAMKQIGQLECQRSADGSVALRGGWCAGYSANTSVEHKFDASLAAALSTFLAEKRVASFGDGPGLYKRELLKRGQVALYDAFDGAPFIESSVESNLVRFLDLSVPIYHLSKYDWIVSLEVAEHIPSEFEAIYVDNIKRHALEGIIISWAVKGQTGFSHINEQSNDYVISLFQAGGLFTYNHADSKFLRQNSTYWWFKNNIMVFDRLT